ncbi:two-component system response regulator HydG [Chitinophaga skermanii]|uniref:Two-component system response regulator HydG n=1 Tax=Chitinophaga skermanii TaxID=331697 RepID=A0A327QIT0_9BACT|nr:sigma-54 dependent transcriptional regulator [Chitinophaga skermanii]RAJ01617.1 two-component system response regulator HydG [Chitinophaga skermanii]
MKSILIVDDEINICTLLSKFLTKNGFKVDSTMQGNTALKMLAEKHYDLVICDYRLKDTDGAQLLTSIREIRPQTVVIIITGYSDVRTAVDMVKNGAFDYISKPLYPDEILALVNKALSSPTPVVMATQEAHADTTQETRAHSHSNEVHQQYQEENEHYVFGESEAAKEHYRQITLVAPTDYTVVIYGETGTGKESAAHLIHAHSKRKHEPFIALDCGSLSKELAASELFGHEKGAFTGAIGTKIGAFEQAHGGTLFLDEIANLSYDIQVALLRVIQEKQIRRVGSMKEIAVDVRLIVASNEKLQESVQKGKFREDLFHRFNEFTIYIPPLRERTEDLPLMVASFLKQTAKELNKPIPKLSSQVLDCILQYDWPGNIRELKNVIRRACLLTPEGLEIGMSVLPLEMKETPLESFAAPSQTALMEEALDIDMQPNDLKAVALKAEYVKIMNVLKAVKYNKTKAAQMLNIDRKTLYNKLRLLNISY